MSKSRQDIIDELNELHLDSDIIKSYEYYTDLILVQELRNIRKRLSCIQSLEERKVDLLKEIKVVLEQSKNENK